MELREKKKKKSSYKKREERKWRRCYVCVCVRRAKENRLVGAVGQLIWKILFLVEGPKFSLSPNGRLLLLSILDSPILNIN
jgi:hypothetical protein